jgi:ribosome-associated protein
MLVGAEKLKLGMFAPEFARTHRCSCKAGRMRSKRKAAPAYTTILCGVKRYVQPSPRRLRQGGKRMIPITDQIALDERDIEESFIRASGPGGQNVNKVASAVQLRFDLAHAPSLPAEVRARAVRLAGRRLNQDGVLVITARRWRSQDRNRQDALDRLVALLRRAAAPPIRRRPTQPSAAAKARRLEEKTRRSALKAERRFVAKDDGDG